MGLTLVDSGVETILEEATSTDPESVLVVNPGEQTTRHLVDSLSEDTEAQVNLLGTKTVLKAVMDDFLIASAAADLVEADRLRLRSGAETVENALIVTDQQVIALIKVDGDVAGLVTEESAFVDRVREVYQSYWEQGMDFSLRTPALGRVRDTLEADIGDTVETDFSAVLSSLETARGDGEGLDEVTISLLVAAKNEALLYDISKWGEDVGIASKATFSRTKTRLEDQGIIDTEKVPIEVGRPRLRLKLADERLAEAEPDELANVALSVIE